jgi:Cd2+/Zn2+-exporting ATPase
MDCPDELALIRKALARLEGIGTLRPDYLHRRLLVQFDPTRTNGEQIAARITEIGFPASLASNGAPPPKTNWTRHAFTATGGTLLAVAAVVYWVNGETTTLAKVLAVLSTCGSALPVSLAAWRAVRLRAIDMNVLMLIAAVGATAAGEFFEAATAMFLFGISLWLESFSVGRARRAVQSLVELTPAVAHRLTDSGANENDSDDYVDVAADSIAANDCLLVKPGERVPVDGLVLRGESALNQAAITGESLPVEKSPGASVFAGSLNAEGSLVIRAEKPAAESTLAHIARLVEQAQASQSPTERFVDRFARLYTPAVIVLAIVLALGPPLLVLLGLMGDDPSQWRSEFLTWFRRSLVLLVIACPCALVISTPVTIVCGLYAAARRGMLIKGGQFLEAAALIDCVAIDKTGTLTVGSAQVIAVTPFDGHTENEVLGVAAALESHSEHPLATAIAEAAADREIAVETTSEFSAVRGFGVQGTIAGMPCLVGSPRLFEQQGLTTEEMNQHMAEHPTATVAMVARGGVPIGAIFLADALRDGAADAISSLRAAGVRRVVMLTGDSQGVADAIAQQAGVDEARAELLPEQKVDEVRRLARAYPNLAMVGDGVNDAPALAAAPLGIALGRQASDTALETADVVVMSPVLGRLAELIRLGRFCRRLLAQNITLALSIKLAVLVAAAAGEATLWMAVAADVGASVLVIFNGMRILDHRS